MNRSVLVLLIEDDPASIVPVRGALEQGRFRLQCVGSVSTGLALIAGGSVNVVLLDLALSGAEEGDRLSHFHKLRDSTPGLPIVVLCGANEEKLALSAVRAGAADYMIKERCPTDLECLLHSVVERHRRRLGEAHTDTSRTRKTGTMITLLGAKGGVGTTTIALNVGAVLAGRNKAIVAELRPTPGTLSQYFRPRAKVRNIAPLLDMEPGAIEMQVESCLWPYKSIPGLNLLFGPQTAERYRELGLAQAGAIVPSLARLADFVVVDLPTALSETNRSIIQASDFLLLVVEPYPICLRAAETILQAIKGWSDTPHLGAVIVNRTPLSDSVSIDSVGVQLGIPVFGVIPPASDVCGAAQSAGTPLVAFDPQSLIAGSITALAERLAGQGPAV